MKNAFFSHGTSRDVSLFKRVAVSLAFATALGFSASASAALETYEFVDSGGPIAGQFEYDAATGEFADVDIIASFGGFVFVLNGEPVIVPSGDSVFSLSANDSSQTGIRANLDFLFSLADLPIAPPAGESYQSGYFAGLSIFSGIPPTVETPFYRGSSTIRVAAVPEPSTYAMMAIGLLGIAGLRRRQNKA